METTNKFSQRQSRVFITNSLSAVSWSYHVTVSLHCIHPNDTLVSFGQNAHRKISTTQMSIHAQMARDEFSLLLLFFCIPFLHLFCWQRSTWMPFEGETMNELMVGRIFAGLLSARQSHWKHNPVEHVGIVSQHFLVQFHMQQRDRENVRDKHKAHAYFVEYLWLFSLLKYIYSRWAWFCTTWTHLPPSTIHQFVAAFQMKRAFSIHKYCCDIGVAFTSNYMASNIAQVEAKQK